MRSRGPRVFKGEHSLGTRMEECPPGADNASVEDDPSKSGNPSAISTPNQTGDEAHVEGGFYC